ncbi:MAG: hypothetical protein ABRQ37_24235, partial [Candidatus Eremiobacterota bacterium]
MNTQEVIELLNLQEIQAKQEIIKKYQVDKATVIRVHANDKYDLSNGMVNIQPLDTSKKFSVGDSVFLQIPLGDKQQTKIVARSNIKIPDEELYEYGEEPVEEGTIYLCCPSEGEYGLIKAYSLSGTPKTSISPETNAIYNICADETYLYCSGPAAYVAFKIKIDGTECQQIVLQARYYNARGLAIDPNGAYLYTTYYYYGAPYGIAKINISTGDVEESNFIILEGEASDVSLLDICSNANYLYVLCYYTVSGYPFYRVRIYDFSCNFITEIYVGDTPNKIITDGTNLYLS